MRIGYDDAGQPVCDSIGKGVGYLGNPVRRIKGEFMTFGHGLKAVLPLNSGSEGFDRETPWLAANPDFA
jgi:hypothetical protein